jgi:hypothetical protein
MRKETIVLCLHLLSPAAKRRLFLDVSKRLRLGRNFVWDFRVVFYFTLQLG